MQNLIKTWISRNWPYVCSGVWFTPEEVRSFYKRPEIPVHVEQLTTASQWSKLVTEVTAHAKHWAIERKYRRIWNKKIAGKVRAQVREQQEKIENAEKLVKNERRLMAKEIAKIVQREFWQKVEKVALLFEEKREEKQMKKQMDEDLNEMMNKTEVFSKSLARQVLREKCENSESSPGSSRAVSRSVNRNIQLIL